MFEVKWIMAFSKHNIILRDLSVYSGRSFGAMLPLGIVSTSEGEISGLIEVQGNTNEVWR